jgi:hypothetical protein
MKLHKRVLFWVTTLVVMVAIFAIPGMAVASTPRVNSNAAIYPMAISPALGAASGFAILAASTVTGTATIIGDVGLYPAAGSLYTALTCAYVTGSIYDRDGTFPPGGACLVTNAPLLVNAQAANLAAFDALSAVPNAACTITYPGTQDLAGLTLVPGVYCADVFTLSGVLTLDDTGAPNGVWIFRSSANLSTPDGGAAKVQFKNGIASPCNVWWKCVSSATIGTYTTFIGNILVYSDISLGTGAHLDGRAFAQTGQVTLASGGTVTRCTTPAPAPAPPSTGLSIFKFNDLNGNGVYEPALGESPLAGKQVTITGPNGYSNSTSTNWAGLIILTGLVPGTYIVTETVLPGWTTPNPQTVTVLANNMTPVKFADKPQLGPTVGGTVMPVDKGGLLIPWLGMAVLLLLATGAVLFIRRRNSR